MDTGGAPMNTSQPPPPDGDVGPKWNDEYQQRTGDRVDTTMTPDQTTPVDGHGAAPGGDVAELTGTVEASDADPDTAQMYYGQALPPHAPGEAPPGDGVVIDLSGNR